MFGWSVNGPSIVNEPTSIQVVTHFISANVIEQQVRSLWNIENEGLCSDLSMSPNDEKVIQFWDEKIQSLDGHYVLPIPFKNDIQIHNNFDVADSRLRSLNRSLCKKGLFNRYGCEMVKMFDKGYAEKVPDDQIDREDKVWYLPHHGVLNAKKPDKLRIVFDCAARFLGESLNDKCLQGPDLNNRLLNVLLRFRQHQFAIMADVEAMYYQVRVESDDRDVLRFLWYDCDGNVVQYRMTSHVFGGIWCACVATYALRHTIKDFPECDKLIVDTVMKAFYVDDCLKAVESRDDAVRVIEGTKSLLSKSGFNLTKFIVNDTELLEMIPVDDRAKEVKDFHSDMNSKALGVK